MTNETNKWIEEASRNTHIKWLAKAKTAIIDGSEMTVLPYGYLQTAVKEVLLAYKAHIKEQLLGEMPKEMISVNSEHIAYQKGYNTALDDMTEIINKL